MGLLSIGNQVGAVFRDDHAIDDVCPCPGAGVVDASAEEPVTRSKDEYEGENDSGVVHLRNRMRQQCFQSRHLAFWKFSSTIWDPRTCRPAMARRRERRRLIIFCFIGWGFCC